MEKTMTSHERFQRMYEHREADRVPVLDSPWSQTIDRWVEEGMPTRDYVGYFDLDRVATITTVGALSPASTVIAPPKSSTTSEGMGGNTFSMKIRKKMPRYP